MNRDELRKLQLIELGILDVFVGICSKYRLRYFLNAGTLLGAVRHKGFIPWDDDIDVCMPRSDYERFLEVVEQSLPANLKAKYFRFQQSDEHLQYTCQIVNLDIPLIQRIAETPRETYAWIDVFPLDGMPQNRIKKIQHGFHLLYRRALMQISMFEKNVNVNKNDRPHYEKLIIWICKTTHFGKRLNTYMEMEKLDYVLKKYPDKEDNDCVNFMGAYKLKETFPFSYYGQGEEYVFERRKLVGPEKADRILTTLYGDYMTPRPPVKNEDGHNLFFREKAFDVSSEHER